MTTIHKIGKWEIHAIEENGKFYAKVFNNNAKKEWNRQKYYYSFKNEQSRNEWIMEFVNEQKSREEQMAKWKAEKAITVNPAKVGDILYSSWGYEQTNIDFYQVIEVKGKSIVIREIGASYKETGYMSGDKSALKDHFLKDSKPMLKRVKKSKDGYYVTIASYADAWLWDGKEKGSTSYA